MRSELAYESENDSSVSSLANTQEELVVLIADDSDVERILTRKAIEPLGFKVVEATDGIECLEAIERYDPCLVVLDVVMPNLDGYDVCEVLRQDPRHLNLPILMVTGRDDVESIEKAFEVGVTDFLIKPVNRKLLGYHIKCLIRFCRIEQELNKSRVISQARSEFLRIVSHEFRTPLNAIIGFSEILKGESFGSLGNDRYVEYADDIHQSGVHLLGLINDVIEFSRLETQSVRPQDEQVVLEDVLASLRRRFASRAEEANITMIWDIASDLHVVNGDERMIRRALVSIITNAINFTPGGGQVTVTAVSDRISGLKITIADTGIGIAPEKIPAILEAFRQADNRQTRKYGGVGLGIPLSKAMIELHGGTLSLKSKVGSGTRIDITIPSSRLSSRQVAALPGQT